MSETAQCPECGEELPANAPGGVCPRCLANQVMSPTAETLAAGDETGNASGHLVAEGPGTVIGPYKLLERLGEGGHGIVYLARQDKPIKRDVALKLIKPGMDTREVIARFEAERQALALMDHPNVARVYDAGTTESQRPYFVMELVKGEPITDYCDRQKLAIEERLKLFITVCEAVQHAHQKAVIHRDIKPSNVIVTIQDGRTVAKVIDFGIAKAISQELTNKTLFTAQGQILGTPAYMSPEQAQFGGTDVDTRTDIYSLGVLLYELLTGTTPLDLAKMRAVGWAEMERFVREEEPPKPSTRITTLGESLESVAKSRQIEPSRMSRMLRRDLDWMVMKALEKDRSRRYETANAFATDIHHYLSNEPVEASPPSASYRLRKFARRNKATLTAMTLVFAALLAGAAVSISQAVRASEAREREAQQRHLAEANALEAQEAAEKAKAVLAFFKDEVLSAARPKGQAGGLGIDVTIRDAIDAAEPKLGKRFTDRPAVEASIRDTLGWTYLLLGDAKAAIPQYDRTLELIRKSLGREHFGTLLSMANLASSYQGAGRFDEALALREETLELNKKVFGPEHPMTLSSMHNLAISYSDAGRLDEALALREETMELSKEVLGPEHPDTLSSMHNLAISYREAGRGDEGRALCEDTLELNKKVLGREHPDTLLSMDSLASYYRDAGRLDEALALGEETLELNKKVLGTEHPKTLSSMGSLASSYYDADRLDEALALREETLELSKEVLGPEHPKTLSSMGNLAISYLRAGRPDEALAMREETLELSKEVLGPEHPDTLSSMDNLAISYGHAGRLDKALQLSKQTLELRKKVLNPEDPNTVLSIEIQRQLKELKEIK